MKILELRLQQRSFGLEFPRSREIGLRLKNGALLKLLDGDAVRLLAQRQQILRHLDHFAGSLERVVGHLHAELDFPAGKPVLLLLRPTVWPPAAGAGSATVSELAVAPVVLWVDEIEKGLEADGADARHARVFGAFLTWLQERRAPVLVAATANEVERFNTDLDAIVADMRRRIDQEAQGIEFAAAAA